VFYLGTKYSGSMSANYLDETGKPQPMEMGCYGIGVTRILGAAIEQNHDARGIVWPAAIAPFACVLCPIGYDRSAEVKAAADALHDELTAAGIDVMLDDRGERPGAMFADWELIGVPLRVVISDRGLKEGLLEVQGRRDEATKVAHCDVGATVKARLAVDGLARARRPSARLPARRAARRPCWGRSLRMPPPASRPSRWPMRCAPRCPPRSPQRAARPAFAASRAPCLPALARCNQRAPEEAQERSAHAHRVPRNPVVRGQACRAGASAGAWPDSGRERLSQVRRQPRRCPRLHADHALLGAPDR
jgi:hypothetical protein